MNSSLELFPQAFWLYLLPGIAAYMLAVLSPLIVPIWFALRRRLTRKLLYIVLVPALLYGGTMFFALLIIAPVNAVLVLFVPTLMAAGAYYPAWLVVAYDLLHPWVPLAFPFALAVASVVLSRYLAARWNNIVSALSLAKNGEL